MAHPTRVALPEDAYLELVGQFAYMVAGVEGLLLFDLPRHATVMPTALSLDSLVGKTTVWIGKEFQKHAPMIADPTVRDYYVEGAERLVALGAMRNAMLHARPATINEKQRLNRWKPASGKSAAESHPIDEPWLHAAIDLASEARYSLGKLRPAKPRL